MYIVSVLYPAGPMLDLAYYQEKHLPLVERLLTPSRMSELVYWQPTDEADAAPFQLIAEMRFPDRDTANAALAAHGPETQNDIPNFTAAEPVILTGELKC